VALNLKQETNKMTQQSKNLKTENSDSRSGDAVVMYSYNYKPYKGFYDLRNYKLSKKLFKKLWNIQDTLFEMNENKEYYKKWHPAQWQEAQLLSADYQRILFQHT